MPGLVTRIFPPAFWAALLAGAALPFALAPFDYWLLAPVSAGVLLWVLNRALPHSTAMLGWWYGVGKYAAGTSWIYVSIHDYGHATPALAGFLVLLFVAGLALFSSFQGWVYGRWLRTARPLVDGFAFAATWTLTEWLLTWLLTGFPWLFIGYAHIDDPLGALAPVGGVLLVGFASVFSVAFVVAVLETIGWRKRLIGVILALLPWLVAWPLQSQQWVEAGDSGRVALVQSNIEQDIKWRMDSIGMILDRQRRLTAGHWNNDLVIWPEAAITLFQRQAVDYLAEMDRRARAGGATLILGVPAYEISPGAPAGEGVFRNTAVALGNGEGRYVKRRLVPFGEYVPLAGLLRGVVEFFNLPMSRAEPGPEDQPLLRAGSWGVAMAICYEIVYPDLVRRSAREADVLVTISNDAWFGRSTGPLQHVQMARMRALENGRWVLRATNNGVTAIIDARGKVRAELPQFETGVLEGRFTVMSGTTPFGRYGHLPLLIALALILAGTLARVVSLRPFFRRT